MGVDFMLFCEGVVVVLYVYDWLWLDVVLCCYMLLLGVLLCVCWSWDVQGCYDLWLFGLNGFYCYFQGVVRVFVVQVLIECVDGQLWLYLCNLGDSVQQVCVYGGVYVGYMFEQILVLFVYVQILLVWDVMFIVGWYDLCVSVGGSVLCLVGCVEDGCFGISDLVMGIELFWFEYD